MLKNMGKLVVRVVTFGQYRPGQAPSSPTRPS